MTIICITAPQPEQSNQKGRPELSSPVLSDNDFMVCVCLRTDTGGLCTFCGAKVSLSKSGASEVRPSAVERLRQSKTGEKAASSSGQGPSSSAESDSTAIAEARAFKDRLVRSLSACLVMPHGNH